MLQHLDTTQHAACKIELDGQDICYSRNGVPHVPGDTVLVLVHGAGGSKLDWPCAWRGATKAATDFEVPADDAVMPEHDGKGLERFPVYALDLSGHGGSGGTSHNNVAAYAAQVIGFLSALGFEKVCLVAHSMGVAVVLSAALLSSRRISSLCLIAGAARMSVSKELLKGLRKQTDAAVSAIARACWHSSTPDNFRNITERQMLSSGPKVLVDDFQACDSVDVRAHLPKIKIPTLVIASEEDRMVRFKDAKAMSDALPMSRLRTYSHCGHFLHVEKSADIAAEIKDFLSNFTA